MFHLVSLGLLIFVASALPHAPTDLKVNGIRCSDVSNSHHEPRVELFSHDHTALESIRFSWDMSHGENNAVSRGHRVVVKSMSNEIVFEDEAFVAAGDSRGLHRMLTASHFKPNEKYKWSVQWKDQQGRVSKQSRECEFLTTTSSIKDWTQAKYIAAPSIRSAPVMAKTFQLEPKVTVVQAVASVVGLGFFRVFVDGKDILSEATPPIKHVGGWTNTEKRVSYVSMDVTKILTAHSATQHSIAVVLGEGYRNTTAYKPRGGRSKTDNVDRVARVNFMIRYSNKKVEYIYSDNKSGWMAMACEIKYDSIYNGEMFDARVGQGILGESDPMTRHNKILSGIQAGVNVTVVHGPPGVLYPTVQPFVSDLEKIAPVKMWKTLQNTQVVDFGENSAGLVTINTNGLHTGSVIRMHHAEVTQHPPYGSSDGSLYYANLRSAQAMDTFISNGNMTEYTPTFTIHGFRYVEVFGYPRTLTDKDIMKTRIYANVKATSSFESSDITLDTINKNCIHAQQSNLQSVPTDCPQRDERLGWMGDAGLSSESMTMNFDMESFLSYFLMLIGDDQDTNGDVPEVVPFYRWGNRPSDPAWGWAFTHISQVLQKTYPKLTKPKQMYPQLMKYAERVVSRFKTAGGCSKFRCSYGDWCPPPPAARIDSAWVAGFASLQTLTDMIELAKAFGENADVTKLMNMRNEIAANCVKIYYNNATGTFGQRNQSSYALALGAKILSSKDAFTLQQNLVSLITNIDTLRITTGIIGAKYILPVLSEANEMAIAMDMITGETGTVYPSWGFMINNKVEPATGLWELWNALEAGPGMNSRNHHMYSSVSQFIHEHIGGIEFVGGYRVVLRPGNVPFTHLKFARTTVKNIVLDWKWETEKVLNSSVQIGVGMEARVVYPSVEGKPCRLTGSDEKAREVVLGSGRYSLNFVC